MQRALAEQELILDNATVGIAFVRNRVIQRCNRFLEEMVGARRGELVGQSSAVLFADASDWKEAGAPRVRGTRRRAAPTWPKRALKRADGSTFICCRCAAGASTRATPSRNGSGATRTSPPSTRRDLRVLQASRDALERAVAERTAELQEAKRARSTSPTTTRSPACPTAACWRTA